MDKKISELQEKQKTIEKSIDDNNKEAAELEEKNKKNRKIIEELDAQLRAGPNTRLLLELTDDVPAALEADTDLLVAVDERQGLGGLQVQAGLDRFEG